MPITLFWQDVPGSRKVAGGEASIEGLLGYRVVRVLPWHHLGHLRGLHVVEQLGEEERGNVSLQGPRTIGITNDKGKVGNIAGGFREVLRFVHCLLYLIIIEL